MANYQELRAQTLGSTQEEEAVTVNTRALIDKVLARYSSENTTLRELIQNAADAGATTVEIRYETTPSPEYAAARLADGENEELQRLPKSKVRRLLVKNNGQAFREEDWQRLKRIAEGNPDETKIGAFGVGFYSVFADTDEPFISSGNQTMAFYWKGNSLFTRRAKMENVDPCTTFFLEYREPGDLPDLKVLCQFFATSLTFVKLESISLYINDIQMLVLNKKVSPPMSLDMPKSIHPVSMEKMMKITEVETSRVQIDAKYMNITHYKPNKLSAELAVTGLARLFFGRNSASSTRNTVSVSTLGEYTTASIFLRIATATVVTTVNAKFAQELERATKKPPPHKTTIQCLTMSKDEQDASEHESEIFENVIPSKSGRIFIGFPTHQTTGINAHIAAHSVIPTVERENIDLNARIVKVWNAEMLRAAGILARILYCDEMDTLGRRAKGLKLSDLEKLYDEAIHIMLQFTFNDSTPSVVVGDYIAEAFWKCTRYTSIELMSTRGVLPSNKIRLANDVTFLEGLPLLPEKILVGAKKFVETLKQGGFLSEITLTDIKNSLGEKPLTGEQAHGFLKWLSLQIQTGKIDDLQAPMLLSGAIAMVPAKDVNGGVVENGVPMSLGIIRYHVNVSKLTADIPLPQECLPFALTKRLAPMDFDALKWKELEVTEWVRYVANNSSSLPVEQSVDMSPTFAGQALAIISKNWDRLPPTHKDFLVEILKSRTCIPTKQGMKVPGEAYFSTVKLFADLPTVSGVHNVKDKFLVALGVRKTVELRLVFERLMGEVSVSGEKWSHVDLIRYLTSVRDDIPSDDIRKLRNMDMCKAEPASSLGLYKVSELYEPLDVLRNLGLPVLQWPGEWRDKSQEAQFLLKLGLQKFPKEEIVLKLAAGQDKKLRERALFYFISYFHDNDYSRVLVSGSHVAFLPLQNDKDRLVRPFECYSNSESSIMGFDVIRNDLQPHADKLGVKSDPDIKECITRLKKSLPSGPKDAREKFGYFTNRMKDLTMGLANDLGNSCIVPVKGEFGIKHITPRICYIGDAQHKYGKVFDFVDFGTGPNAFLMKCGSKPEPTTAEIAYRMAKEPVRLYQAFQNESKYLGMLRTIAEDWPVLKRDKELVKAMKSHPCLAAYRDLPVKGRSSSLGEGVEEEEEAIKELQLAKPEDIFIIDDISTYNIFRVDVLAAPEEDVLEKFYMSLGSTPLSGSIEKQSQVGNILPRTQEFVDLHKLVLERSRLFMHSNNEGVAHDARWLENNLGLEPVQFIKHRMIFKPKGVQKSTHTLKKTASVVAVRHAEKPFVLYVTPNWEFYDIALSLVKLILQRPKPHSSLLLESLLSTDLMTLKHRGYNVGRILSKKQAEARLMEQERLRVVEEQRKASEEQEKRYQVQLHQQQQQQKQQRVREEKAIMPGAFTDSPERPITQAQAPAEYGNFLTRGFNKFSKLMQEPERRQEESQRKLTQDAGPGHVKEPRAEKPRTEKPTEPHRISANLQRAVQSSRGHNSNSVFSPPSTFEVKEENTFCDSQAGQNITYAAETPVGMKVFVGQILSDSQRQDFLQTNAAALTTFSLLLRSVAEVFSMSPTVLHIHYEPQGTTIAFNLSGAIFCNARFFLDLHVRQAPEKKWTADAFMYWWVTVCHELAHNLVTDHGSQHSFYTESFVQEYFKPAMAQVLELEKAAAVGVTAATTTTTHLLDQQ